MYFNTLFTGSASQAKDSPRATLPQRGSDDNVAGPPETTCLQEEHSGK